MVSSAVPTTVFLRFSGGPPYFYLIHAASLGVTAIAYLHFTVLPL